MKSTADTKRFIFILFILSFPWFMGAQNTFKYSYTHPQAPILFTNHLLDTGDSVIFATATRQQSFFYNDAKSVSMLIAMTREGEVLWTKEFKSVVTGGRTLDLGTVQLASDGNLLVHFGNHRGYLGGVQYGTGIVKVSKNGDLISTPNYIDAETLLGIDLSQLILPNPATGGYILGGTNNHIVNNLLKKKHFCAQLDANGQIIPGPENLRFFRPQLGYFDMTCVILDEEQNWYAAGSNFSFVKIKNNATGPEWMKTLSPPSPNEYIQEGISLGNGATAWVGFGYDLEGQYGIFTTLDATGNITSFRRYYSEEQDLGFIGILKNNAGFLVSNFYGSILQLDPAGNVLWAKKHITETTSNDIVFDNTTMTQDNTGGAWILGGFGQLNDPKFNAFLGKIDLNGEVENCCSPNLNVEVREVAVTLQNRPFVIETDSLVNSEWPIVLNDVVLSRSSLRAPLDYALPNASTCTGGCITVLLPPLPPGATASWEFPAGASATFIPGTDSIQICFDNEGAQNLRLNIKLAGDCVFPYDNTINITDTDLPLTFSLADTIFCPGICTDIQLVNGGPASITTLGGTAQAGDSLRICYPTAGTYPITVQQMQEGCLRTHTIEVTVQNLLDETPNAFTPNGDLLNDSFRPIIDSIPDTYLSQIFNRWGEMVLQTENYLDAWDGTYKGQPAPMDTYIWTVNSNNVQKAYKGDVTLIR